MLVKTLYEPIECDEFRNEYVKKNVPVLIKGYGKHWPAVDKWNSKFFKDRFGDTAISTKSFSSTGEILLETSQLDDYLSCLDAYEASLALRETSKRPAYWHDVPIFQMFNELLDDVHPFQTELLPSFYRKGWSRYVQFFMGASGSVTKLHFDTLRTHNLFFQINGRKQWTILPACEEGLCGRKQWRWFSVDPEKPDFERYPEYKNASPISILVEPGDLFYIPPGTLHHVRSLDCSISFNIDFHTKSSVISSFRYIHKGMPFEVMYYNLILFLGLVVKIPSRFLFQFYRSYLNYVS